jgi:hypothetical protein
MMLLAVLPTKNAALLQREAVCQQTTGTSYNMSCYVTFDWYQAAVAGCALSQRKLCWSTH